MSRLAQRSQRPSGVRLKLRGCLPPHGTISTKAEFAGGGIAGIHGEAVVAAVGAIDETAVGTEPDLGADAFAFEVGGQGGDRLGSP